MQPHWVGDLTSRSISRFKQVSPAARSGSSWSRRGSPHRCTIDLATGMAILTRGDEELGQWRDADQGPGPLSRRVRQRRRPHDAWSSTAEPSVGDGLRLRDRRRPPRSRPRPTWRRRPSRPCGTPTVEASDLVLKRDIYYTQNPGELDYDTGLGRALAANPGRALRLPVRPVAVPRPGRTAVARVRDRSRPILHDGRQQPAQQGQPRLGHRTTPTWDDRPTASPGRFPASS